LALRLPPRGLARPKTAWRLQQIYAIKPRELRALRTFGEATWLEGKDE